LLFYYLHLLSFFFYSSADHRDLHSFPTRRSSDLYEKMGEFLKLSSGKLAKLAKLQRRDELKKDFEDPPAPMFQEVRELVLRKCTPGKQQEIRAIFEKQPFGELERLVTQKLLDVIKGVAREE